MRIITLVLLLHALFFSIKEIECSFVNKDSIIFGMMTDLHINLDFDPDIPPHQWWYSKSPQFTPFGRYGNMPPLLLFKSLLNKMRYEFNINKISPSFLLFGGDYSQHHGELDKLKLTLEHITNATLEVFPNVQAIFALGNHDTLDSHQFPPDDPMKKELFGFYYNQWILNYPPNAQYATKQNMQTMLNGAYYSMDLEEVRILSVNTNYWEDEKSPDPITSEWQYNWIKDNLKECQFNKKKIIILAHIPFHNTAHFDKFKELFLEYRDTIAIILSGHEHDFTLFANVDYPEIRPWKTNIYYANEIASTALTPQQYKYNPGFSIYKLGDQLIPLELTQYGFNLRKTYNQDVSEDLALEKWFKTFSSKEDLGLATLEPKPIYDFLHLYYIFPDRKSYYWAYTAFANNYTKRMFFYYIFLTFLDGSLFGFFHIWDFRFDEIILLQFSGTQHTIA